MKKDQASLIIFFVPPDNIVNGGIMSIFSLCNETAHLASIHGSESLLCTYIGSDSYHHNDKFANNQYVFSFDEIIAKYGKPTKLLLHIPELYVKKLLTDLRDYEDFLPDPKNIQINILNQNIEYMPSVDDLFELYRISDHITQTTAHDRYSTQEISNKFGLPLKHLSVFIDPKQYKKTDFDKKRDIIAYSADTHPQKKDVIRMLKDRLSDFQLLEIKDLRYEDYRKLISTAKFVITFGEGFDGYYIEPAFSGTIPIAVYNESFFPDQSFKSMAGIYESYTDMLDTLAEDIVSLNSSKTRYLEVCRNTSKKVSQFYDAKNYRKNIKEFYLNKFDFLPTMNTVDLPAIKNIRTLLNKKYVELSNQNDIIARQTARIKMLEEKAERLDKIESSLAWKLKAKIKKIKN